jgi:putative flippase GtrA
LSAAARWLRFNAVGAGGMVVQLCSLAVLGKICRAHYLWATAAAIEITLLHNFAWHVRVTWADRPGSLVERMVRFQLTNGMVSLVGNVVLMGVLKQEMQMPLLAANAIAIVCCSLVNFAVSDRWAFAEQRAASTRSWIKTKIGSP